MNSYHHFYLSKMNQLLLDLTAHNVPAHALAIHDFIKETTGRSIPPSEAQAILAQYISFRRRITRQMSPPPIIQQPPTIQIDEEEQDIEPTPMISNPWKTKGGTNTIPDFNTKLLQKRHQRPYFSPDFNSWEIDVIYITNPLTQTNPRFYLFCININTKYLVVQGNNYYINSYDGIHGYDQKTGNMKPTLNMMVLFDKTRKLNAGVTIK